jgi:hypothetical protein
MVPGPSRGGAGGEGEETSWSGNETHLVAAGPPGCEPGDLPRRHGLPSMASTAMQALRLLTAITLSRDPLGWWGAWSAAQDGVGAVVEWLKGWDDAAPTDPDKECGEELAWQLVRQLGTRIVPGQRNSRNVQSF